MLGMCSVFVGGFTALILDNMIAGTTRLLSHWPTCYLMNDERCVPVLLMIDCLTLFDVMDTLHGSALNAVTVFFC